MTKPTTVLLLASVVWTSAGHAQLDTVPVTQQAFVKAGIADVGDRFGKVVSLSANTLAVGVPREDGAGSGVDADPSSNGASGAGAVYVFVRDGVLWSQQTYIKAPVATAGEEFGHAVAVSGDTLVVGVPLEDGGSTGVGGDPFDDSAFNSGAAFVYVRRDGTWSLQAYLKASNAEVNDRFGSAVAISGDTLAVGASWEDGSVPGVGGNEADNGTSNSGAVYVFTRAGTDWTQQAYIKASNPGPSDVFGNELALDGDTLLAGAWSEDSGADGVDGNQDDDGAPDAGAAYVFARNGATWSQQAYLKASNSGTGDTFAQSVALSGDVAVVGAYHESSAATGVDGDQASNAATWSGAAYVFARDGTVWSQQTYLKASNTEAFDELGIATAAAGERVAVAAWSEAGSATGVNGNQASNASLNAGAVYLFERDGTTWSQLSYVKASNTRAGDFFGTSVALDGDTLVVGSTREDSAASGTGFGLSGPFSVDSGAAYVYDLDAPDAWADLGQALAGTAGLPQLEGYGSLYPNTALEIHLSSARPSALVYRVIGAATVDLPFRGGTLVPAVDPPLGLFVTVSTDGAGEQATVDLPWPAGLPSGLTVYLQDWIVDPAGPVGLAASNAISGTSP